MRNWAKGFVAFAGVLFVGTSQPQDIPVSKLAVGEHLTAVVHNLILRQELQVRCNSRSATVVAVQVLFDDEYQDTDPIAFLARLNAIPPRPPVGKSSRYPMEMRFGDRSAPHCWSAPTRDMLLIPVGSYRGVTIASIHRAGNQAYTWASEGLLVLSSVASEI